MNKPSYDTIITTVRTLPKHFWHADILATSDAYPVYKLTSHSPANAPRILIVAGVHGEEPGAVTGLVHWLTHHAEDWIAHCQLTIIPVFNPWGYERGIRYASNGKDLNREFDAPDHPTVAAFTEWLEGKTFDLFMDLHEDCDFRTMYLYELISNQPDRTQITLGHRILQRAEQFVPLSHHEAVDDFITEHGMISAPFDRSSAAVFERRPIAIHVYATAAPHVITVETPGLLPIATRARVHQLALQEALHYVTDES